MPLLVYVFTFACNDISGCPAPSLLSPRSLSLDQLKLEVGWPRDGIWGLASWKVTGAVLGYYLLNLILYRIMPATVVQGTVLRSGGRLTYKFNSMWTDCGHHGGNTAVQLTASQRFTPTLLHWLLWRREQPPRARISRYGFSLARTTSRSSLPTLESHTRLPRSYMSAALE